MSSCVLLMATVAHFVVSPSSDVQYLPGAAPAESVEGAPVAIVMAKGEYEPGSFLLKSDCDLEKVELEVGEFKQVEGERSEVRGQRSEVKQRKNNSTVQPPTSNLQPPVVFPKENIDLRVVKVWYQNGNAWFSYFGDTGMKLVPELLLHDENLIRVDEAKKANYARIEGQRSKVGGQRSEVEEGGSYTWRWINPPRQFDRSYLGAGENASAFYPLKPGFADAKTLQPVSLRKNACKQFVLTVKTTKDTPAGLYVGEVRVRGQRSKVKGREEGQRLKVKGQTEDDKHHCLTCDLGPRTSSSTSTSTSTLCSIPIAIRVLDFELPEPRAYQKPEQTFYVSNMSGLGLENIMSHNGFDLELAKRQLEAIMRNMAAHNQTCYLGGSGYPGEELTITREIAKKAGMRTDVLFTGELKENFEWGMKIGWQRDPNLVLDQLKTCAVHRARYFDRTIGSHDVWITYGDEPGSAWMRKNRGLFEIYQRAGFKFMLSGSDIIYNTCGYAFDWFNSGSSPNDRKAPDKWARTQNASVSWYAQQHVGAESPALHRRQNGLAAWLSGYTALNNYEFAIGGWNDDTTTYRPMVYAYGTCDGLVDTLAWEAFREGVDDIRYATLLCSLARQAQARGDWDARALAGKALQYLVQLDTAKDSMPAAREEMIGYIERLQAVLAAKPVFGLGIEEPDGFEAELAAAEKAKSKGRMIRAYVEYGRCEEGEKRFRDAGDWASALAIWRNRHFRGHYYKDLRQAEVFRVYRDALQSKTASAEFKRDAYLWLYGLDPKRDAEGAAAFWGKDKFSTNNALYRMTKVIGEGGLLANGRPKAAAELLLVYIDTFNRLKRTLDAQNQVEYAIHQLPQHGLVDACVKACDLVLVSSNRFTAAKLCGFRYLAETLRAGDIASENAARDLAASIDKKWGAKLPPKDREEAICCAGSALYAMGNEAAVRGYESYRRALHPSYSRRRCLVGGKAVRQTLDRRYKGSLEFLETDVTTGDRGKVGSSAEKLADPTMDVTASPTGLRFVYTIPEPKARQVELGIEDPGAFEMYLAPGKNEPYICFLLTPGKNRIGTFNSSYDTATCRALDGADVDNYRFSTDYFDDRIVCTLELSWNLYAGILPKTGDVWDFEVVRWGRTGNACWNGLESIHGRSTWGELEFRLDPAAQRAIRFRQAHLTFNEYQREKLYGRTVGCLGRWQDAAVGDPEFYEKSLRPLVDTLDGYGKMLKSDMTDEELDKVVREALPKWFCIRRLVGAAREAYLKNMKTNGEYRK